MFEGTFASIKWSLSLRNIAIQLSDASFIWYELCHKIYYVEVGYILWSWSVGNVDWYGDKLFVFVLCKLLNWNNVIEIF